MEPKGAEYLLKLITEGRLIVPEFGCSLVVDTRDLGHTRHKGSARKAIYWIMTMVGGKLPHGSEQSDANEQYVYVENSLIKVEGRFLVTDVEFEREALTMRASDQATMLSLMEYLAGECDFVISGNRKTDECWTTFYVHRDLRFMIRLMWRKNPFMRTPPKPVRQVIEGQPESPFDDPPVPREQDDEDPPPSEQ